jgi:DNA-binding transcriptional ArsR family regulator
MGTSSLSNVFGALADPTRRAIVARLAAEGDLTAGALAEPFDVSKPAISRHLKVLEDAGLIERRVDRQFRVFRLKTDALGEADDWMRRRMALWEASLDKLDAVLTAQNERKRSDGSD